MIKALLSGETWTFGIDTGDFCLLRIEKYCYNGKIQWFGIYFLFFWFEYHGR